MGYKTLDFFFFFFLKSLLRRSSITTSIEEDELCEHMNSGVKKLTWLERTEKGRRGVNHSLKSQDFPLLLLLKISTYMEEKEKSLPCSKGNKL